MLIRTGECNQCGKCCKILNITVVRDVTLSQHKDIKELELYLSYRGICLVDENIEENQLFYSISIPCQQLGPNNEYSYKFQTPSPLLPIETNIAQTK